MNNTKVSDTDLIREVLSGNSRGYGVLLERYQHMVYTLAMRMLRDRELAEETTQDIFVKAYRSLKSFRGDSKFSTWLYRIAYRGILDACDREARLRKPLWLSDVDRLSEVSETTWNTLMISERSTCIQEALAQLSPRDNSLLSLFYLQELSIEEISNITDLAESVVKVGLFRARNRFKIILESSEQGLRLKTYNT
jgi:RNA polymerase sigma-70 factor (ECF subfamily)